MILATSERFFMSSMYFDASRIAMIMARAVLGYFSTNSAVVPSTFSGWSFQISWVVAAVKPMLSRMARAFHGSPTQKPSMLPTRMLATICGGGTVMFFTSRERVDAVGGQPVIEPHRVGAGGEGLGEGVFARLGLDQLGQRWRRRSRPCP